jgi:uncharacterized membrane protein (DUF2068 family)
MTASRDPHHSPNALRAVAMMEAAKGVIVIGAGFGLLTLMHRDVRRVAESLVTRLHIDPTRRYAGVFLDLASANRRWAAWLGAGSGAIYVPVECYELWEKPGPIKAATLAFNVLVVLYLIWTLRTGRSPHAPPPAA